MELHGDTLRLTTATGFPQGGVCSARFWLIAFDKAIRIINEEGIVGNGYADDCSALIGGTHPDNMIEKMQSMLERLVLWGEGCGLRFNPQKTVAIWFTRSTREFHHMVRMNGDFIPYSDTVVYLGVTLDREMKWHAHILNKILKAKQLLMKMANIVHSYWGPKTVLLKWMYTGIVRPTISYAAMTWAHQAASDQMVDALRTLNRRAIDIIVKVPKSTPTRGLEVILDILPLHLHIQHTGFAAYSRIKPELIQWEGVIPNQNHAVSHLKFWELFTLDSHLQEFHLESDLCNIIRPPPKYVIDTSSFVDMDNCQSHVNCNVYTDGSKLLDKVGARVHIIRNNEVLVEDSFRLPDTSTVYQAELAAIKEAAAILTTVGDLSTVKFFVDSQAALRTLQSDIITSTLALQTITTINDIKAQSVTFVWTKAHVGNPGNEKADELAKLGTLQPQPLAIPIPMSRIKLSIKHLITNIWAREWTTHPKARQTKLYHPHLDPSKSKALLKWSRLKLGRYIRAVTGHNNLLYRLHTIDNSISPICRFCLQANEEFFHLATDCPSLWWARHHISAQEPNNPSWSIDQIITFAYLPALNDAFIKPLYDISQPQSAQNPGPPTDPNSQDIDDPMPIDSDAEQESDISVMDVTSESSSTNSISDIDVDDDLL